MLYQLYIILTRRCMGFSKSFITKLLECKAGLNLKFKCVYIVMCSLAMSFYSCDYYHCISPALHSTWFLDGITSTCCILNFQYGNNATQNLMLFNKTFVIRSYARCHWFKKNKLIFYYLTTRHCVMLIYVLLLLGITIEGLRSKRAMKRFCSKNQKTLLGLLA